MYIFYVVSIFDISICEHVLALLTYTFTKQLKIEIMCFDYSVLVQTCF